MRLLRPLPRLRGRDREGACNKTPVCNLTPSPTLPRKREREQTEIAATSRKSWRNLTGHSRVSGNPGATVRGPGSPLPRGRTEGFIARGRADENYLTTCRLRLLTTYRI